MKTFFSQIVFVALLSLFFVIQGTSQNFTISGYLKDALSGEVLIGANIYDSASYVGTTTNFYGFYSMKMSAGTHIIVYSYVGYSSQMLQINVHKDTIITLELNPGEILQEIVVEADAKELIEGTQTSSHKLELIELKKMPAFLGEIDLMKGIQKLPGIQSSNEMFSGIYVRGGSPGQNLILLDGVPVYNVNHLFGFFSVFNTDAINSVNVIKGGFPARYGGRLSSVIDIRMKEGNMKNFEVDGSIGLLSTKLTISGPILKEKTSFIISGRRSYFDVFTSLISASQDMGNSGFWFGDLNVKVNHKFSNKDRLYLSAYAGEDNFYFNDEWNDGGATDEFDFVLKWGNITSAVRWNHVFSGNLFCNTTFTYSRFRFSEELMVSYKDNSDYYNIENHYLSGVHDYTLKVDFDYYPFPVHRIKYGIDYTYHIYSPGVSRFVSNATDIEKIEEKSGENIYANELAAYAEDNWDISNMLKTNIGGRYSAYFVKGKTYQSFEPRLSLRLKLAPNLSLKSSTAYMKQYIHLLTNSSITLPTDLWVPATDIIPPQESWQYALGANWLLLNSYKLSLEGYFKDMQNVIAYKEGAQFVPTDKKWENKVASGHGWSYGLEFMGEKSWKSTNLTLAYTLAWSNRQFSEINFGKEYPYKYDRRHDVNISITQSLGKRIDIALNWIYTSGTAFTIPFEFYLDPGDPLSGNISFYEDNVTYFETRNNYRAPAYHRLDIGINFHSNKKWGRSTWALSMFNAYGRNNPVFMFVENDYENGLVLKKITFFKFVPSISYRFTIN